jgi:hypothetical protein
MILGKKGSEYIFLGKFHRGNRASSKNTEITLFPLCLLRVLCDTFHSNLMLSFEPEAELRADGQDIKENTQRKS